MVCLCYICFNGNIENQSEYQSVRLQQHMLCALIYIFIEDKVDYTHVT